MNTEITKTDNNENTIDLDKTEKILKNVYGKCSVIESEQTRLQEDVKDLRNEVRSLRVLKADMEICDYRKDLHLFKEKELEEFKKELFEISERIKTQQAIEIAPVIKFIKEYEKEIGEKPSEATICKFIECSSYNNWDNFKRYNKQNKITLL